MSGGCKPCAVWLLCLCSPCILALPCRRRVSTLLPEEGLRLSIEQLVTGRFEGVEPSHLVLLWTAEASRLAAEFPVGSTQLRPTRHGPRTGGKGITVSQKHRA